MRLKNNNVILRHRIKNIIRRQGEWAFTREGMIRIENATNVSIVGCELLAAGTSAVWMEHFAQSCSVVSNWIEHASFTGVHINGWDIDNGALPQHPYYQYFVESYRTARDCK